MGKKPFKPEGFVATADVWIAFFEEIKRLGLADDDEEGRIMLLRRLVKEKKAQYLPHPLEYLKGKNVTHIKKDLQ